MLISYTRSNNESRAAGGLYHGHGLRGGAPGGGLYHGHGLDGLPLYNGLHGPEPGCKRAVPVYGLISRMRMVKTRRAGGRIKVTILSS